MIDAVFRARHVDADRLETNDRTALFGQLFVFLPAKKKKKVRMTWRIKSSRVPRGGRVAVTVEVENGSEDSLRFHFLLKANGDLRMRVRVRE